ncbi:hypothetical protein GCM10029964_016780 [Kibdelosporangium lantanae]
MTYSEPVREGLLVVVWCALILRTPMVLRDRRQLPLWQVLAVFAATSLVMREGFGAVLDRAVGDPTFHMLFANLWDVLGFTSPLYFAAWVAGRLRHRLRWGAWALFTVSVTVVTYVLAPEQLTFPGVSAQSVVFTLYLMSTTSVTVWLLYRHVSEVRDRVLGLALWMIILGEAVLVPYMGIVAVFMVGHASPPWLVWFGYVGAVARFTLLPLGCVVATFEPVRKALVCRYQHWRLRGVWQLLTATTPQLRMAPPADSWEALHRRIVEIRDSIFHLYDTWATEHLVATAHRYTNDPVLAVACWLEVTRRAAEDRAPRLYQVVHLPSLPDTTTAREEMRWQLGIHRAMRSPETHWFADRYVAGLPGPRTAGVRESST